MNIFYIGTAFEPKAILDQTESVQLAFCSLYPQIFGTLLTNPQTWEEVEKFFSKCQVLKDLPTTEEQLAGIQTTSELFSDSFQNTEWSHYLKSVIQKGQSKMEQYISDPQNKSIDFACIYAPDAQSKNFRIYRAIANNKSCSFKKYEWEVDISVVNKLPDDVKQNSLLKLRKLICGEPEVKIIEEQKILSEPKLIIESDRKSLNIQTPNLVCKGNQVKKEPEDKTPLVYENVDLRALEKYLKISLDGIQNSLGKEVSLIIGNTGAGKSTLVNYLLGVEFEKQKKKGEKIAVAKNEDQIQAKIGQTMESETLFPSIFEHKNKIFTYCDCPGFLDNQNFERRICISYCMSKLIQESKALSGVILVINWASFIADRGNGIRQLSDILSNIIVYPENLEKSFLLIITKADSDLENKDVVDKIEELCMLEQKYLTTMSEAKKDHEEFYQSQRKAQLLYMIKEHPENILIPDIFDKGQSRVELEKALAKLKSISRDDFTFQTDSSLKKIQSILVQIFDQSIHKYQKFEDNRRRKKQEEDNLSFAQKEESDAKKDLLNLDNNDKDQQNEIAAQKNRVQVIKDEITQLEKQRQYLLEEIKQEQNLLEEISSEKQVVYFSRKISLQPESILKRVLFWLDWAPRQTITYEGPPIANVEKNCEYGAFESENRDECSYSVTFVGAVDKSSTASVTIYVRTKDLPEHAKAIPLKQNRIQALGKDLKNSEENISIRQTTLERKVAEINDLERAVKQDKEKKQKQLNELIIFQQDAQKKCLTSLSEIQKEGNECTELILNNISLAKQAIKLESMMQMNLEKAKILISYLNTIKLQSIIEQDTYQQSLYIILDNQK